MAETKTKKAKGTKSTKAAKPKRAAKPSRATKPRRAAKPRRAGTPKSSAKPKAPTKPALGEAGEAVRKARLPLLAGGAAIAGTVGGVVLGASRSGGKVLGIKLPAPKRVKVRSKDLATAAKEVGRFGENVGDLTTELKRMREGIANGNGNHSSPIEVVLRGLTNRR
jgi:hypothetical protein